MHKAFAIFFLHSVSFVAEFFLKEFSHRLVKYKYKSMPPIKTVSNTNPILMVKKKYLA